MPEQEAGEAEHAVTRTHRRRPLLPSAPRPSASPLPQPRPPTSHAPRPQVNWLREQIETPHAIEFTKEEKMRMLDRLCWSDHFEVRAPLPPPHAAAPSPSLLLVWL